MTGGQAGKQSARGFTLIEVVVALAVLAVGMTAVLHATSQAGYAGTFLKQRTVAHWVASNRAAELTINREWLEPGTSSGTETMAEQTWHWETQVQTTVVPELRLVTIRVTLDGEEMASLVTFVSQQL